MKTFVVKLCVLCCALLGSASVWANFYGQSLVIGYEGYGTDGVGFHATNDAAGYSDWIWYGPTDIHEHAYHEVLSGEWGAAIYYDGIDTPVTADPNDAANRKQAMWLTKEFSYPNWYTNSDFVFGNTCFASSNPNNPAPNQDMGQS